MTGVNPSAGTPLDHDTTPGTIYRELLGADFDRLPRVLRRFHDLDRAQGRGSLRITRGRGVVRHLISALLRLPAPGEAVPVFLVVQPGSRGGQVWTREYGRHRIVTRQWEAGGLLVEAAGPYRCGFRLTPITSGLKFEFVRAWLGLAPIPRCLAVEVEAEVTAGPDDESWRVDVRVKGPLFGLVARYEGEVSPLWGPR